MCPRIRRVSACDNGEFSKCFGITTQLGQRIRQPVMENRQLRIQSDGLAIFSHRRLRSAQVIQNIAQIVVKLITSGGQPFRLAIFDQGLLEFA